MALLIKRSTRLKWDQRKFDDHSNNWQDWKLFNEDINSIIEIDDRPEYMRVSAFLAFQLYQVFNNKKIEIPKVLVDWKESCLNSAFPEVRKIWEEFN